MDGALYARAYNGEQSRGHPAAITQKAGRITSAGLTKDVVFETGPDRRGLSLEVPPSLYLEAMIGERARSATVEILPRSNAASNGE